MSVAQVKRRLSDASTALQIVFSIPGEWATRFFDPATPPVAVPVVDDEAALAAALFAALIASGPATLLQLRLGGLPCPANTDAARRRPLVLAIGNGERRAATVLASRKPCAAQPDLPRRRSSSIPRLPRRSDQGRQGGRD